MSTVTTAPQEAHVVIVGTYAGTDVPQLIEYLTPDYDLEERVDHWTRYGYSDVHPAQQVTRFTRLTPAEAEEQRS